MASVKRILGTLVFVVVFVVTCAFFGVLYLNSIGDENVQGLTDSIGLTAIVTGAFLGLGIVLLILILLIRSSEERRRKEAFQEEADLLAAERERLAAFESGLDEPEKIGWGPEIVVYNLPTVQIMHRAWEKFNRRTNSYPFYYPRSVEAAVYTNNYIPIDSKGTMLKLRTLIAGPPGAQAKDLGMSHQKRPVNIDPKTLDEKWRRRLEEQTRKPDEYQATPTVPDAVAEPASTQVAVATGGRTAVLQEIETRFARPAPEPSGRAYYDYDGDVAKVEEVEGIGRIYGEKLRNAGVETTARLCYEDAQSLADRVGVPVRTVEQWKGMSELIKVSGIGPQYAEALARSGIMGIADLKRRGPGAIAEQVNAYLDNLHTNVLGTKITEKRVQSWQKAASGMRKVRMKAPEK